MMTRKLLRTTWLALPCRADSTSVAKPLTVEAMTAPWWNPGHHVWFVSKSPDRTSSLTYTAALQQLKLSSLVHFDKLLLQNGSTTYGAVLSSDHVGIGKGFAAADFEPISMPRLTRRVQENLQRNIVPVSLCGYEETDGRIRFETMWMPSKTIEYQVQFDNQDQTTSSLQNQGYYAVSACSTKTLTDSTATPSVVIVWHRQREQSPDSIRLEQRIAVDISEEDCLSMNTQNTRDSFYPISMQLFNKGNDVRCTAIWQKVTDPSLKYELRTGSALVDVVNLVDKEMKPRQVSVYQNRLGREQLMVLWTNYDTRNVSFDGSIYSETDNVPIDWLPGSTSGMKAEDKAKFESTVIATMRAAQIPALTLAVSRHDQLKRAVAFGYANPLTKEAATVTTKFRLGSVSKVLTSVAIFSLIDQGMLNLNATIFGPGSILGTEYGTKPYSENLLKVRLVNLLEHTSGGWGAQTTEDSLFAYEGYNQSTYIGVGIDKYGPTVEPGTVWDYANFGYYLLSVIITKVTGKSYEQYIKEKFWRSAWIGLGDRQRWVWKYAPHWTDLLLWDLEYGPAGVPDAQVGIENRWFSERQPNEAVFFPDAGGLMDSYDVIDAERVASAGGWIASPMDVLRVARLFNGFSGTKDILSPTSLAEMVRPSKASNDMYCRGIAVGSDFLGVWHNGYYPGGSANYQRQKNGIELMYMHNKGPDISEVTEAISGLGRMFIDLTPDWPQHDLFSAERDHFGAVERKV